MSCRAVSGGSRRSAIFAVGCILAALLAFLSAASARAAAFTAATVGDFGNVTVMTVSGNYDADLADGEPNVEPRQIIAREFFRTHRDDYDFLVIFTSFPFQMPAGEAAAFYAGVRNDTQGLGLPLFDYSADYGSAARLQGTIDMGELASHVADPLNPRFDETLGLLNHELLHRWGAHLKFRTAGGSVSDALLGRDGDHWSYLLDTRGSVLYGSRWRDNGDGTFTALEARTYFSPLDLYVMGMIGKEQVPPMLLIENPSLDPTRLPEVGATISGTARTVTIDEIIAAVGERLPRPDQAQKRFKVAFIYAAAPGSFSGSELPALENIRNGFLTRYSILTDGQGLVQVAATPKVDLPTNPGTPGPTVVPRTAPADLAQGAAWLAAMQEHDGSWLDAGATRERDTAEAAAALRLFPETQAEAEEGLGWLASHDAANTDYLARRIETLADAGRDCAALVAELVARRNADGGWGAAAGFASTAGDTALALKALVCAGSTPSAAIADGVGYLNTHRNADGGWGGEGGASQVQPTADALLAFNALRTGYPVEAGLNTAAAWLLGKQNPDGGFGNSPSTVYDTAAAVLALHELGAPGAIVGRGANYLLERQAQDGSWEGSPYQTAVAVRAAWQAVEAPDVAVTADGISFIPEQVTVLPTQTVLQAAIRNLGRIDAPAVSVVLYEGGAAGGARLGEQVVACPGRSETVVTFAVPVTEGRERLLTVAVDPDGVIEESNEGNNQASKALRPAASVDFALAPDRVTLSASAVEQFQTVAIRATVANRGTQDAFDVPVRFFIDLAGALVEIATLAADLPAGGEATVETSWLATLSGAALPVTIVADPFGAFAELDEGNNRASQALTVTAVSRPNLAVASPGVTVSPDPVPFGDAVTIAATVVNSGGAPATNVRVDFYHGVPGHGGALLVCQTVPLLGAGQSLPLTAVWSDIQEAGGQIAFVVIDPLNAIVEGSEADNEAFASFAVRSLPDLALTADAIAVMPAAAREGETVTVQATVRNLGDQVAEQVRVRLSEAEVILQEQIVPQIEGQALASIAFSYDTTGRAGAHTVLVEVDPEGVIVEQRKENNRAEKTFGVQNANFWLSEQYISPNGDGVQDDTRLFFRLETPQTVRVAVVNEDGETVRTFSGAELENVDVAEVVWDGLDDLGRVVDDGEYRLRVQASAGGALGELAVMVDNNRSPFAKAIGTPFLRQLEVPEYVGEFAGWHRDESYYLVQGTFGNEPYGLFRLAAVDGARERLNPEEWYAQYRSDKWLDVQLAPAGDRLAVINLGQLWVTDAFTPFQTATSVLLGSANSPRWSPDGAKLAFQARVSSARWGLFVVSADGTGGMRLDDDSNSLQWSMNWWDDAFISYKWAPDASRIVYETPDGQLWLADLSGAKTKIFDGPVYSWQWLDRNRLVAVRYDNDNCYLIDAEAGYSELLAERVSSYFVSPSGQYLLAFDYYSKIKAYDLDGKRTVLDEYFDNIYWTLELQHSLPTIRVGCGAAL
jgi:subtilase family serine protease